MSCVCRQHGCRQRPSRVCVVDCRRGCSQQCWPNGVGHHGWGGLSENKIASMRGTHLKGKTRPKVRWHRDGVLKFEMMLARARCHWFCRVFRLSVPAVVGGVVPEVRTGQNMKKKMRTIWDCGLRRVVHICELADKLSDPHRSGEWAWTRQGARLVYAREGSI